MKNDTTDWFLKMSPAENLVSSLYCKYCRNYEYFINSRSVYLDKSGSNTLAAL